MNAPQGLSPSKTSINCMETTVRGRKILYVPTRRQTHHQLQWINVSHTLDPSHAFPVHLSELKQSDSLHQKHKTNWLATPEQEQRILKHSCKLPWRSGLNDSLSAYLKRPCVRTQCCFAAFLSGMLCVDKERILCSWARVARRFFARWKVYALDLGSRDVCWYGENPLLSDWWCEQRFVEVSYGP